MEHETCPTCSGHGEVACRWFWDESGPEASAFEPCPDCDGVAELSTERDLFAAALVAA